MESFFSSRTTSSCEIKHLYTIYREFTVIAILRGNESLSSLFSFLRCSFNFRYFDATYDTSGIIVSFPRMKYSDVV